LGDSARAPWTNYFFFALSAEGIAQQALPVFLTDESQQDFSAFGEVAQQDFLVLAQEARLRVATATKRERMRIILVYIRESSGLLSNTSQRLKTDRERQETRHSP